MPGAVARRPLVARAAQRPNDPADHRPRDGSAAGRTIHRAARADVRQPGPPVDRLSRREMVGPLRGPRTVARPTPLPPARHTQRGVTLPPAARDATHAAGDATHAAVTNRL